MAVVEIHTGIVTSPKHMPLSDAALRLWLNGLCWSKEHLTDGFVPTAALPALHPRARKVVSELLTVIVPGKGPLWHEADGGYRIHDYEQWQETKERVQGRRQAWLDRKRKQRDVHPPVPPVVPPSVTHPVTPPVTREEGACHAGPPSDGSGGGSGSGKRSPKPPAGVDPLFDRFWSAYPRHTGKAQALKAWTKLAPDESLLMAMLAALNWQRRQDGWTKDDGKFIPHPTTWLNGRRWEDEHPDGALNGTELDEDPIDPRYDLSQPYTPRPTRSPEGW